MTKAFFQRGFYALAVAVVILAVALAHEKGKQFQKQ